MRRTVGGAWAVARGAALAGAVAVMLGACEDYRSRDAVRLTGGNPQKGRELIGRYGCDACHTIPGVPGARGRVGPPLAGIASRMYVAGVLQNTPPNLQRWIKDPQLVDSATAMPNLRVTDAHARDIAAYLYTLR
jgi:cytochrome c